MCERQYVLLTAVPGPIAIRAICYRMRATGAARLRAETPTNIPTPQPAVRFIIQPNILYLLPPGVRRARSVHGIGGAGAERGGRVSPSTF